MSTFDDNAGDENAGDDKAGQAPASEKGSRFWALTLGSIGVVFGDIGTSPLYAMREALHHRRGRRPDARRRCSASCRWLLWALILIVTVKYVLFLMRADNNGEGGTLSLMALAQPAIGRRTAIVFVLGVAGAALFYGDGIITPAISVLSAVEGLELGRRPTSTPYVRADLGRSS